MSYLNLRSCYIREYAESIEFRGTKLFLNSINIAKSFLGNMKYFFFTNKKILINTNTCNLFKIFDALANKFLNE